MSFTDFVKTPKQENITYSPIIINAIANGGSSTVAINVGAADGLSIKLPVPRNINPNARVSIPVRNHEWFFFKYLNSHHFFL